MGQQLAPELAGEAGEVLAGGHTGTDPLVRAGSVIIVTFTVPCFPFPQPPPDRGAQPRRPSRSAGCSIASTDFLDGFKEVRLNAARSAELFDDAVTVSRTAANIKIGAQVETFKSDRVVAELHVHPARRRRVRRSAISAHRWRRVSITKTTTALLFVVGACFGLVQSIPILMNANAAADRHGAAGSPTLRATVSPERGRGRRRRALRHASRCARSCSVTSTDFPRPRSRSGRSTSPCSAGELVFITGGNGSGKSTFLRVLAGLYPPTSGEITLDGMRINNGYARPVSRADLDDFLSTITSFAGSTGFPIPIRPRSTACCAQFRLEDKTGLSDGEFRTLDLSGGQRRRLALIVSAARKAADSVAGRVDGRTGPRISAQILRRTAAGTDASRHHRRGDHPR